MSHTGLSLNIHKEQVETFLSNKPLVLPNSQTFSTKNKHC